MTDYRNQLLRAEAELESIRDQNTANKDVLKHRTKNMIEQVESLRSRYEACETRRKREAEGYQVNIFCYLARSGRSAKDHKPITCL